MVQHYFPTFEAESDLMKAILSLGKSRKEAKAKSTNSSQARQHSIPERYESLKSLISHLTRILVSPSRFELKNDEMRARYLITNFRLLDNIQTSTIPLHTIETNRWRTDAERVRYVLEVGFLPIYCHFTSLI